ncbi:MFS transporter [Calidifontibacter terrae]
MPANIGTLSRARWAHRLADSPGRLHSAMSLEQVTDELAFVLGPALAVGLATLWFPEAGVLAAGALGAIGTLLFLSERETEPPVDAATHHQSALAVRTPGIVLLAVILFMTGTIFGSNEVSTVAVAKHLGQASSAGLVIGLFALGSAVAGLWFGTRTLGHSLPTALIAGTAAMFLLETPILLAVDRLTVLGLVLLVAGAATAPTLIIAMQLAQRCVPRAQSSEAMSVVLTGLLIGVAVGSAASGSLIQRFEPGTGFLVTLSAGAAALLIAVVGRPVLKRGLNG